MVRDCSIATALAVVGDKWSLLVIRELYYGVHRFEGIAAAIGAPRDILATRLRKLEAHGVIERRPYQQRPVRHEYVLTPRGAGLRDVLLTLKEWGDVHLVDRPPVVFAHDCGDDFHPELACAGCAQPVAHGSLHVRGATEATGTLGVSRAV